MYVCILFSAWSNSPVLEFCQEYATGVETLSFLGLWYVIFHNTSLLKYLTDAFVSNYIVDSKSSAAGRKPGEYRV